MMATSRQRGESLNVAGWQRPYPGRSRTVIDYVDVAKTSSTVPGRGGTLGDLRGGSIIFEGRCIENWHTNICAWEGDL